MEIINNTIYKLNEFQKRGYRISIDLNGILLPVEKETQTIILTSIRKELEACRE